jgi:hypothetical protein
MADSRRRQFGSNVGWSRRLFSQGTVWNSRTSLRTLFQYVFSLPYQPPADWDFQKYNTDTDFVYDELLRPTNFANVTVPHKQNRAILFDSALFHHTDKFSFKKGHENHRINLTLLYGNMKKEVKQEL